MKNIFLLFQLIFLFSCSKIIDKPSHLIDQSKMSEILADMAIHDQAQFVNTQANLESSTRFVLKKHQITAKDFSESYKYYTVTRKIEDILDDSKQIIVKKFPDSKPFIDKRLKETSSVSSSLQQ